MILDAYGRRASPPGIAIRFIQQFDLVDREAEAAAAARVEELRRSVLGSGYERDYSQAGMRIGETINVRIPRRYEEPRS